MQLTFVKGGQDIFVRDGLCAQQKHHNTGEIMASVNLSSLIGAQAYATQLRRQYSQEESERALRLGQGGERRREPHQADKARTASPKVEDGRQPVSREKSPALRTPVPGNPTASEIAAAQPNPTARPLYSSTRREAPNPNAQLRNIRPGTHLDITV